MVDDRIKYSAVFGTDVAEYKRAFNYRSEVLAEDPWVYSFSKPSIFYATSYPWDTYLFPIRRSVVPYYAFAKIFGIMRGNGASEDFIMKTYPIFLDTLRYKRRNRLFFDNSASEFDFGSFFNNDRVGLFFPLPG